MKTTNYYTPPGEEIFEETRQKAIGIWETYDDTFGYARGKIDRIKNIENVGDNFMYIVAMFDSKNQAKLAKLLSDPARQAIRERMIDGGMPEEYIYF